ncbi:MAG: helix-turn-helix domain-containing protein [Candidatus Aenigmarchaeota archaeon]|nr:helix-turn-helix domain-containing protein [Candidatus Aenigmarchaeota archaeon]
MWVVKLRIKHDCTIAVRCKKFKVTSFSWSLMPFEKGGKSYTYQMHHLVGKEENIKAFIKDLKEDKRITNLEVEKNVIFFIEVRPRKEIPSSFYNPEMFYIKPCLVDTDGYEVWELASVHRSVLTNLISELEKIKKDFEVKILKLAETKLSDVYYPRITPKLTKQQKIAIDLAVKHGYYSVPRKANLEKLSKIMGVSLSTFQEHLRKAEGRLIPDLLKEIE